MPAAPAATALPAITLVLGGARSGKSAHAEALIGARPALYIATAQSFDSEMNERIREHQARRGPNLQTIEEPLDLAGVLIAHGSGPSPILVDCLTLWLTNVLLAERDVPAEIARLCAALPGVSAPLLLVSNEVGLGIVPDNALARTFRDHAGRLNQQVAALASRVTFMAAGLPLQLKG
jgi:adenosylcobinamide kinase/adenosylcobinamide-phosphate guanylyltransferase